NALSFEWAELPAPGGAQGESVWRLLRATDTIGRVIEYRYDRQAKLTEVVDTRSGLRATYAYRNGELRTATDWAKRRNTYEYQNGFPETDEEYASEYGLREGCELA